MKCKILHPAILCLALLLPYFASAQDQKTDSAQVNYAEEFKLLKEQVAALQKQVEQNTQKTKQKSNIIDRTKISSFAIFRVAELDWNQIVYNPETNSGEHIQSRFWSRILANVYLDTKITDRLDYRFSVQVFPGFAYGGDADSRLAILLDEVWLKFRFKENQYIKVGRQDASEIWPNQSGTQFDFWRHDGVSYQYKKEMPKAFNFYGKAAFYIESYRNNESFKNQGSLYGFSLNLEQNNDDRIFSISSGIIKGQSLMNRFKSDLQNAFWDGDLAPDYTISATEFIYKIKPLNNLSLKVDYYYNFKNYKSGIPSSLITDASGKTSFDSGFDASTAPDFSNQRSGVYVAVRSELPFISRKLTLSGAYMYMEKYAALDLYAQFDLARWASTNLKGYEVVLLYKYNDRISFRNRTFFMEEIKGLHGMDPSFRRGGNRTRFDIIINI
ncbi:hypothetical protein K5I29_01905 [Flavobacterium agricola]|uniref:Phosphate-selective porin O and P n=1 Tax=Flavobacterium agricola TaxID=2870839 RepID=A0ABY6M2Q2_9FLAO|nr:hypothetical protein [Flavobacterium agricola]UYW01705.1 hypothetical protein K5I29_01905 [Flavobacterium agricola]